MKPFDESALPEIPGGWTEREIGLGHERLRILLPSDPDAFLDDPEILAEHARSGFDPYWGHLWPVSLEMSEAIYRARWERPQKTLELGCGIGLCGLAAGMAGHDVLFTDYAEDAVRLSLTNAVRNGISARGELLDWKHPGSLKYDWILGCEVIYEPANQEPILELLDRMLTPGGAAWFGDLGRFHAGRFVTLAQERGYRVSQQKLERLNSPGRPEGFSDLWILEPGERGA